MIVFLEGVVEKAVDGLAWINVNGVGYGVEISTQTEKQLPESGQRTRLLTHHHISDSDERLFGFATRREKALFEYLITVKGVGPKLGLTILSGMDIGRLTEAILDQDQKLLSGIPGIGKKTAERIILELKDKILDGSGAADDVGSGRRTGSGPEMEEAISALEALGFPKRHARERVKTALENHPEWKVSEIVKEVLKTQHS